MQIRCPHCLTAFDSADDASWTDLVCPSCGDPFSLSGFETTRTFQPGFRVLGRFELLHEVGAGKFGSVWKARDTELHRSVAIKIPRQQDLDPHEIELFFRDARAAAQLKHPHIASVHEVGREDDTVYIVTDFIDGANLSEWLSGRRLTTRESAELVVKIAEALDHAHEKGVVHRDVKPGNIMLDRNGEPFVIDFGLARRDVGEKTLTVEGQVLGTPAYMPPEQARGEGHRADRRSDIYSLGVIMFKLLTGELPFRGETRMLIVQILEEEPPSPRKLNSYVSRDLETITLKCLEKDPSKRYPTARELADDLRRYLAEEPIKARPVGRLERGWRWCKRHPEIATLSAALLLVLVAAAIISPVVALNQARLRHEAELRRIDFQNQVAHNLFQRAIEEYGDGRTAEGIALLAGAYRLAVGDENPLRTSIPNLMSGWSRRNGRPIVHDHVVLATALSPDGRTALIAGHHPQARLWNTHSIIPMGEPLKHSDSIRTVAFSPDGRAALTGSQDGTARLWDLSTGRPLTKPLPHSDEVWVAAFSPDGSKVVTGGRNKAAQLWDARTGEALGEPMPLDHTVLAAAFSPDGRIVVTATYDGVVQKWDAQSQQPVGESLRIGQAQYETPVYAVAFHPHDNQIITASANKSVQFWNSETLAADGEPLRHEHSVYVMAFSDDGNTLLTGSFDNTARLWSIERRQPIGEPMRHGDWVMSVAFSPDGRTALTGSADRTARLWTLQDTSGLPHTGITLAAAFSGDGRTIITGGDDKTARLWDAVRGTSLSNPLQHDSKVQAVALSADGRIALTGTDDGRLLRWDTRNGTPIRSAWKLSGPARRIHVLDDPERVLIESTKQSLQLGDLASESPVSEPLEFEMNEGVLAVSPDGSIVLIKENEETARLWDVRTGKPLGEPLRHVKRIVTAAFGRDGRTVATGGYDQHVRLWDDRGKSLGKAMHHGGIVRSVAFSHDGKTILSGSSAHTARLWDAPTRSSIGPPLQHDSEVVQVDLAADGRQALTICSDGSAHLWDLSSFAPLARSLMERSTADGDTLSITGGRFNADGSVILFECSDGTARLYPVPQPLPPNPKFIDAWAKAQSGFECDEKGVLRQLSQAQWLAAKKQAAALEDVPR